MIYEILIILSIVFIGFIGIWFAIKYYKKKKKIEEYERNVPKEVLDIFYEAEQEMKGGLKEDGTTTSPTKILWEIAKRQRQRKITGNNKDTRRTEQTVNGGELYEQPSRQEDIQIRTTTIASKDKSIVRKSRTNNFKRIISRIRSRRSRR